MWEALEILFYYLKSKNKRLPTVLALVLVATIIVASYKAMKPRREVGTSTASQNATTTEAPQKTKGDQEIPSISNRPSVLQFMKEAQNESVHHNKTDSETSLSYTYFLNSLQDRFQAEGLDPGLAVRLFEEMNHYLSEKPENYDLSVPVKRVFPEITILEFNKITSLIVEAIEESLSHS